ncbi:coniferyl aldehyde dehydrogenase [Novosphingobium sp. NBM11]|uniref:coniferyl aldehyde dehydrogenase n=1 Tax=unclassified Novosphingobium TaxID=2644732 RepID=UPI000F7FA25F|nr:MULTISPECIES: coniferyl aldehyde dehydrogenase [unclassified Novosphingobium]MBF5091652.1 coniferyl aldehyde dehydrogenase [Novosphingobium sp. NBM11]
MNETNRTDMLAVLERQRTAFTAARPEALSVRHDRLERCATMLKEHGEAFAKAMSADFGHRSHEQSMLTDIMPSVSIVRYSQKRMKRWSRPEKRHVNFPLNLLGARAEVRYEPKGVIGIVAPWNFPVGLTMAPLAQAFAAGNRAMLKPSEFTERTSELMQELFPRYFAEEEVAVITGGPETGQAFCGLPFDHLLFTGATPIGRHVLHAAADHLVPVTLELGGKSPTIFGRSADLQRSAERVALGKMMNAGQICLAPDYMMVPEELEDRAIAAVAAGVSSMYPTLLANDDYTSVINRRHRDRLAGLVEDAREKGAEAIVVNPGGEDFAGTNGNKMPLTILRNVNDDMRVMQEEIFGPVLPVKTYRAIDEVIDYVNAHDRPLGLYYFGQDKAEAEKVLTRTISGGVTVNDVIFHVSADDLPFGGIGPSGMGSYHGVEGFRTFSHARAVYRQPKVDLAKLAGLRPPYGAATQRTLKMQLK